MPILSPRPGAGSRGTAGRRPDGTVPVKSAGRAAFSQPGETSRSSWGPAWAPGCRRCRGLRRPSKRLTSTARMPRGQAAPLTDVGRVTPPTRAPTDQAWVWDGTERRSNASVRSAL